MTSLLDGKINRKLKFFVELHASYLHAVEEFRAKIAAGVVPGHATYEPATKVHEILLVKVGHKITELRDGVLRVGVLKDTWPESCNNGCEG